MSLLAGAKAWFASTWEAPTYMGSRRYMTRMSLCSSMHIHSKHHASPEKLHLFGIHTTQCIWSRIFAKAKITQTTCGVFLPYDKGTLLPPRHTHHLTNSADRNFCRTSYAHCILHLHTEMLSFSQGNKHLICLRHAARAYSTETQVSYYGFSVCKQTILCAYMSQCKVCVANTNTSRISSFAKF